MLLGIDGLDGLLGVHGCGRCDNDGFQAFLLQHIVVVLVELDSVGSKVDLGPFDLSVVRGAGGDELRAGSALQEVEGVALAHAAEARATDFEALGSHCGVNGRIGK